MAFRVSVAVKVFYLDFVSILQILTTMNYSERLFMTAKFFTMSVVFAQIYQFSLNFS